ncbi:hypothetical protein F183_A40830 [Bryobacterales bacterium F-183]|nr:hypothetical protein F183_A40830 [Bryobacterales bacterium F-183]
MDIGIGKPQLADMQRDRSPTQHVPAYSNPWQKSTKRDMQQDSRQTADRAKTKRLDQAGPARCWHQKRRQRSRIPNHCKCGRDHRQATAAESRPGPIPQKQKQKQPKDNHPRRVADQVNKQGFF